eukprot:TRINITY_DN14395_c0_g1_i3.p1 TRINITY_DN14395_c0_g1~~TRINITY_DN14395_c0_g1_i3.p1  ORF type:complete len:426 (+),score=81.38 TRINITY_DN14395_c0_g1_i3:80-1357(+)
MAAVPSWEPGLLHAPSEVAEGSESATAGGPATRGPGRYSVGLSFGEGRAAGELLLSVRDLRLGRWRHLWSEGLRAVRGGTSHGELQFRGGRGSRAALLSYERPVRGGRGGAVLRWERRPEPPAPAFLHGQPRWVRQGSGQTSGEGRLYWRPPRGGRELWARVRSERDGASGGGQAAVAALGGRAHRSWSWRAGGAAAVAAVSAELGLAPLFARCEIDGALRTEPEQRRAAPGEQQHGAPWLELRAAARALTPLLPPPLGAPPPPGECYTLGGQQVRGFTESGLCPASASRGGVPLPATAVVTASAARLAPLDDRVGGFAFIDAGACSGLGAAAPGDPLPLRRRRAQRVAADQDWLPRQVRQWLEPVLAGDDSWSTPVFCSCGLGVFLLAAPQLRAGVAWPLDRRLRADGLAARRERIFLCADGHF